MGARRITKNRRTAIPETQSTQSREALFLSQRRDFLSANIQSGTGADDSLEHMILATTLLAAGDHEAYRAACMAAAERFKTTTLTYRAEHIAKSCLFAF